MKQPKISSSIMGDMKHRALKMGRAISKFFHYNRIPPNVATSPYYRAMVDTIAEVGHGVKPPSTYEISEKYLDMEYDDYTRYLEDHFQTWKAYGCTLMCDGWTSDAGPRVRACGGSAKSTMDADARVRRNNKSLQR
ncbi:hypothetical protein CKAN_00457000 [Cinnamomum micranthum f. kanehirae]|uniref:Uncharacterized protein n=1 Tax=Cinnamomum micranthum f. kanehirae TaxID=337451 RepID=A0A3S3PYX1_9MAGN|nr:hypothetical protein CKAN_00457000 [Cinnamomum micranthum f. kanehirae]